MNEPNFQKNEEKLVTVTTRAIQAFAAHNSSTEFAYFSFDCNADFGEVLLCLDSRDNSVAQAKKTESRITAERRKLSYDDLTGLEWAKHKVANDVTGERVLPFGNNTGDFSHQAFAQLNFEEWADFFVSDEYPDEFEESGVSYLEAKLTVMFSRIIDELVAQNAFGCLRTTSPFYIGFAFHEGPQYVVRIINW